MAAGARAKGSAAAGTPQAWQKWANDPLRVSQPPPPPLKQMNAAMRTEIDHWIFQVQRARNRGTRFCPIGSAPGNESHSIDSAADGVFPFLIRASAPDG